MSQVNVLVTMKLAAIAVALVAIVTISAAVRGVASPDGSVLGRLDDFGTRHTAASASLGRLDDFGTRHTAASASLGRLDDFGTRHSR